jgi:hypothetical protein
MICRAHRIRGTAVSRTRKGRFTGCSFRAGTSRRYLPAAPSWRPGAGRGRGWCRVLGEPTRPARPPGRRVGVITELLGHQLGAAAGPSRCRAELMAAAIMPASKVSEGCSADASSAAHRAWLAACRTGSRGVLACMGICFLCWFPAGPAERQASPDRRAGSGRHEGRSGSGGEGAAGPAGGGGAGCGGRIGIAGVSRSGRSPAAVSAARTAPAEGAWYSQQPPAPAPAAAGLAWCRAAG